MQYAADVDEWSYNQQTPVWEPQETSSLSRQGTIHIQEIPTVQWDPGTVCDVGTVSTVAREGGKEQAVGQCMVIAGFFFHTSCLCG
jgi:hypothetical protein